MAEHTGPVDFVRPIRLRLFGLTIVLLVASLIAVSFDALRKFEADLVPETERKAVVVGHSLAADVVRALDYGIPLNVLSGMKRYLSVTLGNHPEIKYIAVTDLKGEVLHHVGADTVRVRQHFRIAAARATAGEPGSVPVGDFLDNEIPIIAQKGTVGALHVGVDKKFIQKKLEDILFDVLIVLLVSLLITFELLLFLVTHNISRPIESVHQLMRRVEVGDFRRTLAHRSKDEVGRFIAALDGLVKQVNEHYQSVSRLVEDYRGKKDSGTIDTRKRLSAHIGELLNRMHLAPDAKPDAHREFTLVDIRTPMFIFVFAEELSRSFFPLYVSELYVPVLGLSREVVIGLPISLFMLFVAIGTPFAGVWTDRFGSRRLFLVGATLAVVGFLGTALAYNLYDLLVWRSITAIAYAMVTMACQGYIVSITTDENRAQGMAVFIGAIMVAAICGTSIGGVLADRLGFRATFFMSTGLAIASAIFVYNVFSAERRKAAGAQASLKLADFLALFRNTRFMILMLFGAIPAKLILTGFLFYLTPLYLNELGNSQSEIGRAMMLYFVLMVFGTPLFARIADKYGRQMIPVAIGGLIAGGGALALIYLEGTFAVVIGVAGLGLGHALSTAPLISMVPSVCRGEVETMGQTTVLSVFRVLERVGSVAGPFAAAALVGVYGFADAVGALGIIVLSCTVVMAGFFLVAGMTPRQPEAQA